MIRRALAPLRALFSSVVAGGVVLLVCTALALVWANSPWRDAYDAIRHATTTIGVSGFTLSLSVEQWINDGLMAVFFFAVGLEIRREVIFGRLSSRRSATLPVAAALGGMIVPATIYALVNRGGAGAAGWGVPMATDIAFALGILAILGSRVPSAVRVFLAAVAIADDLGAVLVIALFYTATINWIALAAAAGVLVATRLLARTPLASVVAYTLLGVALWLFVLRSGIHPTVAGVLLAFAIPADLNVIERLEHALSRVVAFAILPVFALVNAGVPLAGLMSVMRSPIALGVAIGLVIGKPVGITLTSYLAIRAGVAELPEGVRWSHLHGASWLAGIGFTMSLFIAGLAFPDAEYLSGAKIGVLGGSIVAGVVGYVLLHRLHASQTAAGGR